MPVVPGSTLTFRGAVTAVTTEGAETSVEVEFRAGNQAGDHGTRTATVTIPA